MPELPEVETIAKQLNEKLQGRTIKSVTLLKSGREFPSGKKFVAGLVGKKIQSITRRAKLLIWKFTDGSGLTAHLKMTGRFVFVDKKYQPQKHDQAVFEFVGVPLACARAGARPARTIHLVWSDVRKFGFMKLFAYSYELAKALEKFGPEPLESSAKELAERLIRPKTRKVKVALMDQTTIAGIGNIYADEALFRAKLRPTRRLSSLAFADRLRLAKEIQKVLKESLRHRGTSASDYVDSSGQRGSFLKHLRVYGRAGERCVVCGTAIKRIVIGQRGTHYCPTCQR